MCGTVEWAERDYQTAMQRARLAFRRYHRINRRFPLDAAWDATEATCKRLRAARKALVALKFESIDEFAIVAAALVRAGHETGNWIDLPIVPLLGMLAGDEELSA